MRKRLFVLILSSVLCLLPAPTAHGQALIPSMAFVADVTVADDTMIAPGELFTKTWLVQNTGSSDWTENYALAFVKGDQLEAADRAALGKRIGPGESVGVAVAMQAPAIPGRYVGWWRLVDDSSRPFGTSVYVRIVVGSPSPTAQATDPQRTAMASTKASQAAYLSADNPAGVWVWSAPKGQHEDRDVLALGMYHILQQTSDGRWAQLQTGSRTVWVYSGESSGTHRVINLADASLSTAGQVPTQVAVAGQLPAQVTTAQLLDASRQDPRRAIEMWKARIEWCERQNPSGALAAQEVPGITKGPGAIYRVIDTQTSDIMARLAYEMIEPIFYIRRLGVFVPGYPALGQSAPSVPAGVEALTDHVGEVEIRYDYLTAPNPNFPMPVQQWPKIRPWALLAALAHEGTHIRAGRGDNDQEAVGAQKQILLAGAQALRAQGDEASAVWLERLASVVRSGTANPITGAF